MAVIVMLRATVRCCSMPSCIIHQARAFHGLLRKDSTSTNERSNIASRVNVHGIVIPPRRMFSTEFYTEYLSSASPPIGLAQSLLENVHDLSGLPWWATLFISTMCLRTLITLPVAIFSLKNMDKVTRLQPEIVKLSSDLKLEVRRAVYEFKWETKYARYKYNSTMRKLIKQLYIRDNCHPVKSSLIVLTQIPLWVCMSFALRNMSGCAPTLDGENTLPCPELVNEGIFWFTNLTVADTTFILPIVLGVLNLVIVEINAYKMVNPTKMQKTLTNLFRGLSVVMIPVGASVPSCMCFYWTVSSFYGLVQNLALKRANVRAFFGLSAAPPTQATTPRPEAETVDVMQRKGAPSIDVSSKSAR